MSDFEKKWGVKGLAKSDEPNPYLAAKRDERAAGAFNAWNPETGASDVMPDHESWHIVIDDRPELGSIKTALEEITPQRGLLRLERWLEHNGSQMQYVLWFHGECVWKSEVMNTK